MQFAELHSLLASALAEPDFPRYLNGLNDPKESKNKNLHYMMKYVETFNVRLTSQMEYVASPEVGQ